MTITKNTAAQIAYAYQEIEAAESLLKTIEEAGHNENPNFRDVFGRTPRGLQLGIPSGDTGHRLYTVNYSVAAIILKSHINEKKSEIEALCLLAKQEMGVS